MEAQLSESVSLQQEALNETTSCDRLRELANQSPELAKLVANNESADSELLRELGSHFDPVVRKHLVMNPNTPPEVLLKLVGEFPRQLFNNPAIDLLLIETPNLLAGTSATALCSFLKRTVPVSFLEYAANSLDERVQLAVAMNSQTPKIVLEWLAKSQSLRVVEAAKLHINWAGEIAADWKVLVQKAMKKVLKNADEDFESALIQIGAIREFSSDLPQYSRSTRLANPTSTPVDFLEKLAHSRDWRDRRQVASALNTPICLLERLADDADEFVRIGVFNNPKSPRDIIISLSEKFENLGGFNLANYGEEFIRNPYVSASLLDKLLAKYDEMRQEYINYKAHKEPHTRHLGVIARHPNIAESSLKKLLTHEEASVRLAAATNPRIPKYILEVWGLSILSTMSPHILEVIASSLNAPNRLLEELVKHENNSVRIAAATNPCAGESVLEQWESTRFYTVGELEQLLACEQQMLQKWESSPTSSRLAVLLDSQAPSPILAKISRSSSWLERCAIAQNPNTPTAIRQRLTQDGNRVVRAAASSRG